MSTTKEVQIWCSHCHTFVKIMGEVYEEGAAAPTYVTPAMLKAHRATH